MRHGVKIRVAQSLPDLRRIVVFVDRAHGAVRRTLSALDAGAFVDGKTGGRGHLSGETPSLELQGPCVLYVLADADAPSAPYALGRVENDGGAGIVHRYVVQYLFVGHLADAEVGGKRLKLAAVVTDALQTVVRVVGKNQLKHRAPCLDNLRVVGNHVLTGEARVHRGGAGPYQLGCAAHTDDADPAGTPACQIWIVTQSGDFYPNLLGRGKNRGSFLDLYRNTVNRKLNHQLTPFSSAK